MLIIFIPTFLNFILLLLTHYSHIILEQKLLIHIKILKVEVEVSELNSAIVFSAILAYPVSKSNVIDKARALSLLESHCSQSEDSISSHKRASAD